MGHTLRMIPKLELTCTFPSVGPLCICRSCTLYNHPLTVVPHVCFIANKTEPVAISMTSGEGRLLSESDLRAMGAVMAYSAVFVTRM